MGKTLKQPVFHSLADANAFAGIIDRLRNFSIENATPVETMIFLVELQHEIAAKDCAIAASENVGSLYY